MVDDDEDVRVSERRGEITRRRIPIWAPPEVRPHGRVASWLERNIKPWYALVACVVAAGSGFGTASAWHGSLAHKPDLAPITALAAEQQAKIASHDSRLAAVEAVLVLMQGEVHDALKKTEWQNDATYQIVLQRHVPNVEPPPDPKLIPRRKP